MATAAWRDKYLTMGHKWSAGLHAQGSIDHELIDHTPTLRCVFLRSDGDPIPAYADAQEMFKVVCQWGYWAQCVTCWRCRGGQAVDIHMHADGDEAFNRVCQHKRLDVVRELIKAEADRPFDIRKEIWSSMCCGNETEILMLKYILSLEGVHLADTTAIGEDHSAAPAVLLGLEGDRHMDTSPDLDDNWLALCRHASCTQDASDLLLSLLLGDRRVAPPPAGALQLLPSSSHPHMRMTTGRQQACSRPLMTAGFQQACRSHYHYGEEIEMVRSLPELQGGREMDVHANNDLALRKLCKHRSVPELRGLLFGGRDVKFPGTVIEQLQCLQKAFAARQVHFAHKLLLRPLPLHAPWLPFTLCTPDSSQLLSGQRLLAACNPHALQHMLLQHWTPMPELSELFLDLEHDAMRRFVFKVLGLVAALPALARDAAVPLRSCSGAFLDLLWYGVAVPLRGIRGAPRDTSLACALRWGGR